MELITVAEFDSYSGNYEATTQEVALKETYLSTAQGIVEDFLRYKLEQATYTNVPVCGNGLDYIQLPAGNVTTLSSVTINGSEMDVSGFTILNNCLMFSDLVARFPKGRNNIRLAYTAGYDSESLPQNIKLTILRIATLLLMEAGENIGVTGKSMPDNSRTFINYTSYMKYLRPIQNLRLEVF